MGGFSSVTGDETIMFADNASFDGTQRGGKITTNGQLFIGSTVSPHIRVGNITSTDVSVTVTNNAGNIDLSVPGASWFVYKSDLINFKVTGLNTIFTPTGAFSASSFTVVASTFTNVTVDGNFNIGWTPAAYDDWAPSQGFGLTDSQTYSNVDVSVGTPKPLAPIATPVVINITTGITADVANGYIVVYGFYI